MDPVPATIVIELHTPPLGAALSFVANVASALLAVTAGGALLVGHGPSARSAGSVSWLSVRHGPQVLVELYQSQGCASCPPAEDNFNAIADRPDVDVTEHRTSGGMAATA